MIINKELVSSVLGSGAAKYGKVIPWWWYVPPCEKKGRHSHLCENAIRSIKRTLYFILRRKKSQNWSKYLSQAVDTVNRNFNPGIGYLQPAICNEELEVGDQMIR